MLNKSQSNYLWTTSWFSLIASFYGLYNSHQIAILPGLIFITSLNHWRNPVRGSWRQRTDIITVVMSLYLQKIFGSELEYYPEYVIIVTIGLSFYPMALYFLVGTRFGNPLFPIAQYILLEMSLTYSYIHLLNLFHRSIEFDRDSLLNLPPCQNMLHHRPFYFGNGIFG